MAMHAIDGIPRNCQILLVEQEVVGDDDTSVLQRVLLLDEPTNHLDLHAVLWLDSNLVKWPKTFIIVSHAREYLNTVVTDIPHLHGQKLTAYKRNFDTFDKTREEKLKNKRKTL